MVLLESARKVMVMLLARLLVGWIKLLLVLVLAQLPRNLLLADVAVLPRVEVTGLARAEILLAARPALINIGRRPG